MKEDIGLTKYLNCINYSRKFQEVKTLTSKREKKRLNHAQLKQELRNAIIKEIRFDIEEAVGTYFSTLSRSVPRAHRKKKVTYDTECTNISISNHKKRAGSKNSRAARLILEFDLKKDKHRALRRIRVRSETRNIDLKMDNIRGSRKIELHSNSD